MRWLGPTIIGVGVLCIVLGFRVEDPSGWDDGSFLGEMTLLIGGSALIVAGLIITIVTVLI